MAVGLLIAGVLFVAGCEDVADRLSGPILQSPPQTHVFASDSRTVYSAARTALDAMNFRFTHGGPSEGVMEGVGGIVAGEAPGTTKQVTIKAEFHPAAGGGTEVSVRVTELSEDENGGHAAESSVAASPIYDVFFRAIQQSLNGK